LSRDWKEAREKRISIPDTDPKTLEGYINWIYTQHITLEKGIVQCVHCIEENVTDNDCSYHHSLGMVEMYTLGDYLGDLQFYNAVVDKMKSLHLRTNCGISPYAIELVWEHTASDSPLREVCLESWKRVLPSELTKPFMQEHISKFPEEFLIDLLSFVGQRHKSHIQKDGRAKRIMFTEKCKFHKHAEDSDQCS
jgi:hypothetical protein